MEYEVLNSLHRTHQDDFEGNEEDIMMHENNFPLNAKIGLVFTTYVNHQMYMKYALEQYRKIKDMFIVGAYDAWNMDDSSKLLPIPADVWRLSHCWTMKHQTWGGHRKRHGYLWTHIYAAAILRMCPNIEYIFSANGDCVWDRPEGVYEIIDLLGDNDFISGQSYTRHTDGFNFIHTCSMLFKREAYLSWVDFVMEKIGDRLESYSPEDLIQRWLKDKKWEHAPVQPIYSETPDENAHHDFYCEEGGPSTWRDVLGFRNILAEKNWRSYNRREPLDKKYFDLRVKYSTDHDKRCLFPYYETGDHRYIELQWDTDPQLPRDLRIERKEWTIDRY